MVIKGVTESFDFSFLEEELSKKYETPYGALYAPFDKESREQIHAAAIKMKALNPSLFILVGIGGSNMGCLAVIETLYGNLDTFMCADTIDADLTKRLLARAEGVLKKGEGVILCIITKSGTTVETLVNAGLFLELLKKYQPHNYNKYLMIITDGNSPLKEYAQQIDCELLTIPTSVGGRFSIFTAVGLFPLAMLNVNIDEFCKGAQDMLELCLSPQSPAAESASTLFVHYKRGYVIHDIFVFSPDLLMLGNWYKQLIGESLGKKYTGDGALAEIGITPTVSIGTTDLHSVVQLYLAGPYNRITTFVPVKEINESTIPLNEITSLVQGLSGSSISFIKEALLNGVMAAYEKERRPFMITPLEKKAYHLGGWMLMKMVETMLLGRLFNINPFDQPAVELYKTMARSFMR